MESELLNVDEKKWVTIIAKETYDNLLLINNLLNSTASHLDRSVQLKLSPVLQLLTNIAKKRKWPHLNDTWSFNEEIMGLGLRNFNYMSYSICKLSKLWASWRLTVNFMIFSALKAGTATCWSAELCIRLNFQLLLSWVHI